MPRKERGRGITSIEDRCNNSETQKIYTHKEGLISAACKSIINRNILKSNRKTSVKNLEKKNGKTNNFMDISGDKLRKLQKRWT